MPNWDQDEPNESFALSYMVFGLFGVFIKRAKGGYVQTPKEMAKIVIPEILKNYQTDGLLWHILPLCSSCYNHHCLQ